MRRMAWAALLLPALVASAAVMVSAAVAQETRGADIKSAKAMLPHCAAGLAPDAQDIAGGRCFRLRRARERGERHQDRGRSSQGRHDTAPRPAHVTGDQLQ